MTDTFIRERKAVSVEVLAGAESEAAWKDVIVATYTSSAPRDEAGSQDYGRASDSYCVSGLTSPTVLRFFHVDPARVVGTRRKGSLA